MLLIVYYIVFLLGGSLSSYLAGLIVERAFGSYARFSILSEHPSPPLNHPKSDSYAAPTAERRSAGSGISNPEGSGPSPGCRPEAFPVRPPRRGRNPDRLPSWATRQRALRIDLEYDRT